MDQPDLDPRLRRGALRALDRINRISGTVGRYWPEIGQLSHRLGGRRLRVIDVACGGGDVAIAIERRAARHGIDLEMSGCDASPEALAYARSGAERAGAAVDFFECDATGGALPESDVALCSLFLHHLDDNQAVNLLGLMTDSARHLVLVSDLVRSRLGHVYAYLASRLLTRSPVVRTDAMLSVEAAFTVDEAASLARRARPDGFDVRIHFPQRYLLTWRLS